MKLFQLLAIALFASSMAQAQKIYKSVSTETLADSSFARMTAKYGPNKIWPNGYEKQAIIALSHYPELATAHIQFVLKPTRTPLTSRPTVWSVFRKPAKRTYIITISTQSIPFLEPILLQNLSFNAQTGVLGHELSHVAYYMTKNTWQMLGITFGMLSKHYTDTFENNTDKRCIDHGLGYQLLGWSQEVRQKLELKKWNGADHLKNSINEKKGTERYMSPSSIEAYIKQSVIYNE